LAKNDLPHLIIEGCRGSGKSLRTLLFLQEKFGPFSIKNITLDIEGVTDQKDINIMISPYHYQINPSTHSFYDRMLIKAFTSEVLKYKILAGISYRILIIEDADLLTREAQESLRRILELYISTCRFIFLVNNEGKLIDPLYSRCIKVNIPSPTDAELGTILTKIMVAENCTLPEHILTDIVRHSKRNVNKAIGFLERYILRCSGLQALQALQPFKRAEYDDSYAVSLKIVDAMIKGTDIESTMDEIRVFIYELLTFCMDPRYIIPDILEIALERIPKRNIVSIYEICQFASLRDSTIRASSKQMYHIESFCIHLFDLIKKIMTASAEKTKLKK
jgi:replication factor C subunit 3/5